MSHDLSPFVKLFGRYLREQGLPVTHQRDALAAVIFSSDGHLSVDDIERELSSNGKRIGKATIYRTLDLLVQSKLVASHDFGEGFKRYEHRLSREPIHQHLICLNCGKVIEFQSPDLGRIEDLITSQHGFKPVHHRLELYGLCKECLGSGIDFKTEGLSCPIEDI
jgi:Fur family ferric uptake transcriptional regulator